MSPVVFGIGELKLKKETLYLTIWNNKIKLKHEPDQNPTTTTKYRTTFSNVYKHYNTNIINAHSYQFNSKRVNLEFSNVGVQKLIIGAGRKKPLLM